MTHNIKWHLSFSILLAALLSFGSQTLAKRKSGLRCSQWYKRLKKRRLVLSVKHRNTLIRKAMSQRRPRPNRLHRKRIKRYASLRRELEGMRRCFARQYKRTRSRKARKRLLHRVEQTLRRLLSRATLPLWLGTPWDYYGTATYPHQKSLACGYFVTHALRSVGFRFPQNFIYRSRIKGAMHIYEFAKQTGYTMLRNVSSSSRTILHRNRPAKALLAPLRRLGPGIYIMGLDNHVGLVLFDGSQAYFWHSGGTDTDAWVKREPLAKAPQVVASGLHVVGKLTPSMYKRWLFRRPIRIAKRR